MWCKTQKIESESDIFKVSSWQIWLGMYISIMVHSNIKSSLQISAELTKKKRTGVSHWRQRGWSRGVGMVLEEVSFHSSKDKFDPKQGTSRRTYRVRRMSCWRLWLIARMLPPWRSIWTWHWVIRWHAMLSSPSSESGGGEEPRCAHNHWSSCSQPCWYALVTSVSNFLALLNALYVAI